VGQANGRAASGAPAMTGLETRFARRLRRRASPRHDARKAKPRPPGGDRGSCSTGGRPV
jgi:hypothetical protein